MCYENVRSVACVPVGLTKYREKLAEIEPFNEKTACEVLDIIEEYAVKYKEKYGIRKVYGADEFYLLSGREIPDSDFYGDFDQLDNGVGMWALLKKEAFDAIELFDGKTDGIGKTIVTGVAAEPLIKEIVEKAKEKWKDLECEVIAIKNNFFGEKITVSGLVTGGDIIKQLSDQKIGKELLLPSSMLRYENDLFLDNISVSEVEEKLNVKIKITDNDGYELIDNIMGVKEEL
ncbi:MAG: DUF512 domain-containing protein [Acutalibacteraceae bacterium]|nr:DUF512 domain-containing protein [Acutalibacteraceae bacterium]